MVLTINLGGQKQIWIWYPARKRQSSEGTLNNNLRGWHRPARIVRGRANTTHGAIDDTSTSIGISGDCLQSPNSNNERISGEVVMFSGPWETISTTRALQSILRRVECFPKTRTGKGANPLSHVLFTHHSVSLTHRIDGHLSYTYYCTISCIKFT